MTQPKEEFRTIAQAPQYEVSNIGRIRSNPRFRPGKILVTFPMKGRYGYRYVNLYRDGKRLTRKVSCLVCEAFHGPKPSPFHEAAHNNGIDTDDRSENLRWATRKENAADRVAHGTQLFGSRTWQAKLTEADVRAIRAEPPRYGRVPMLATRFNVSKSTIDDVLRGKSWAHLLRHNVVLTDERHAA